MKQLPRPDVLKRHCIMRLTRPVLAAAIGFTFLAPMAAAYNPVPLCPALEEDEEYDPGIEADFCNFFVPAVRGEDAHVRQVFALHWNGSFIVPDTMKIIVFQHESGEWQVDATVFEQKRREKPREAVIADVRYISTLLKPHEAKPILRWLTRENVTRIKNAPAFPPNRICLDGTSLRIFLHTEQDSFGSWRHGCVGRTAIDEFAELIIDAAGKTDPVLKRRAPPTLMKPE